MIKLSVNLKSSGTQKMDMNTILSIISGILIIAILFSSCHKISGEGPVINESRETDDFSAVAMNISGVLKYTPDTSYKIEIKAQQNILNLLETYVRNGKLIISIKRNTHLGSYKPIEVSVHAPSLTGLEVNGSANIVITDPLYTNHLDLNISGSGSIHTDSLVVRNSVGLSLSGSGSAFIKYLESSLLQINISGSGDILANKGMVRDEEIKISGSGKIDISSIAAENALIQSSGSGNVRLNVSKQMEVHISGSGSVYYKGSPQIKTYISGSGKIVPL